MKTKFNFWGIMTAAVVMLSAGAGFAGAKNQDQATHFNAETDPTKSPNWQPITPGSPGENACLEDTERPCKAMVNSLGQFVILEYGSLEE